MKWSRIGTLCCLWFGLVGLYPSVATSKGTRDIGLGIGLGQQTVLQLDIRAAGEVLSFCSSDDGQQSLPVDTILQDLNPGGFVERNSRRSLADIVLYPPNPQPCSRSPECEVAQLCMDPTTEQPISFSDNPNSLGECAFTFTVTPTADPTLGFCDHFVLPTHRNCKD